MILKLENHEDHAPCAPGPWPVEEHFGECTSQSTWEIPIDQLPACIRRTALAKVPIPGRTIERVTGCERSVERQQAFTKKIREELWDAQSRSEDRARIANLSRPCMCSWAYG